MDNSLIGRRYGKLVVVRAGDLIGRLRVWVCKCDCGVLKTARRSSLTSGRTTSCGCAKRRRGPIVNVAPKKEASLRQRYQKEYSAWIGMKARCTNDLRYVSKNIRVCPEWASSFETFFGDMGPMPSASHTVDRIKTHGNYQKDNCRWATRKEQARNLSNTVFISIDGEHKPLTEHAELHGIEPSLLRSRLAKGWTPERAVLSPRRQSRAAVAETDSIHVFTEQIEERVTHAKHFKSVRHKQRIRW